MDVFFFPTSQLISLSDHSGKEGKYCVMSPGQKSKTIAHLRAVIFLFTEIYFFLLYSTAVNKQQMDGGEQRSQHKTV